jgi:4-hydroxybenzoate polyprenyltransferase
MVTATGIAAGLGAKSALLAITVLVGQLSIGWSNDAIDAPIDHTAERTDKPIVTGNVSRHVVTRCATVALIADVPLSLSLGWRPGLAHLLAVLLAWSYNAGLKRTVASPLPYAVAFGLVPAVVVAAMLPGAPWPRPLLVVAGACCGLAGHLANTVNDAAADALTGVRGLPQRLGPADSTLIAAGLVATAAAAVLAAVGAGVLTVGATVVDVGIALTLPAVIRKPRFQRAAFAGVLIAVAILLVAFISAGGSDLTSG